MRSPFNRFIGFAVTFGTAVAAAITAALYTSDGDVFMTSDGDVFAPKDE